MLDALHDAGIRPFGQKRSDLLLRDPRSGVSPTPRSWRMAFVERAQDPDQWRAQTSEHAIGAATRLATRFRIGQRQPLRYELTDDQRQVGDRRDHAGQSPAYRRSPGIPASRRRPARWPLNVAPLMAPARMPTRVIPTCTVERNPVGSSSTAAPPGAAIALVRTLLQPTPPRRHHRQLGHGKDAVEQHQPKTIATSAKILMARIHPSAAVRSEDRRCRRAPVQMAHAARRSRPAPISTATQRLASRDAGNTKWSVSSA